MYYNPLVASELARMRTERAEQNAERNWRFRKLRTRESQVLKAIAMSVLELFLK